MLIDYLTPTPRNERTDGQACLRAFPIKQNICNTQLNSSALVRNKSKQEKPKLKTTVTVKVTDSLHVDKLKT